MTKSTKAQWLRFILVGGVNTLVTYLAYLLFLEMTDYRIAFTVSFVLGIVIAYSLNTWVVFRTKWSLSKLAGYPLVYLVQYGLGLLLLAVQVDLFGVDRRLAPLISVAVLIPVTFTLNRWFLTRRGHRDERYRCE